ncbi:MAG: biopolymer transporter ExbD [Proteobacteria bacterium]|nr:biopolymer transporter ExbD [Pseudomonadota bacterium]
MSKFRFKKRKQVATAFEVNVTPMLDLFSVLIIFLLATSVLSSVGELKIEVPFLSSKPPPPQEKIDKNPEKTVSVTIDVRKVKYQQATTASSLPANEFEVDLTEDGLDKIQAAIYAIRKENAAFDKVTVFTQPEVSYAKLVMVLDSLRDLRNGRTPIAFPAGYQFPSGVEQTSLITKIVLGDVLF